MDDASCDISPCPRRLRVHQTGSRGGAKARRHVHCISEGQTGCLPSVLIRGLFFNACGRDARAPRFQACGRDARAPRFQALSEG
jgi:hypothetical protein